MGFGHEWPQEIRLLLWPGVPGSLLACRIWSLPLMKFCLGAPVIWWVSWISIYVQLQNKQDLLWIPVVKFPAKNIFFILCHHFHPFSALSDFGLEAGAGVCFSSMENPGSLWVFWSGETWGSLVDASCLVHDAHPLQEGEFVTSHLECGAVLLQVYLATSEASDF